MKKVVSVFGIIGMALVIGFGIIGCATGGAPIDKNTVLVCFGDSLTSGESATGTNDKSKSYPAYLQKMVNIRVVNAGVSGDTTAQALARIQRDVISKNPAIVIVELGGNDLLRGIDISITKKNLNDIFTLLKDSNVKKIYLIKFPNDAAYVAMYNDLTNTHGIDLIEVLSGIWPDHMADDLHPNATGYQIMAENTFNAMKPYLQANNMVREN